MSDAPEIVARPPSHPTATTLIFVAVFGTIAAIGFVWAELFTEYLPGRAPGAPIDDIMQSHDPVAHANASQRVRDHYAEDFGTGDVLQGVEKELGLQSGIGSIDPNAPIPDAAPDTPPPADPPPEEGGGNDEVEAPEEE